MGCLIAVLAMLTPRVVMIFIWLLTDWFSEAFKSALWPVLGFIFVPYTTLAYTAAMLKNDGAVTGWWLVLVILAVVVDMGSHGGSGRSGLSRRKH